MQKRRVGFPGNTKRRAAVSRKSLGGRAFCCRFVDFSATSSTEKSLALKRESRPSLPPIFFGGETKDPTSDVMHKIWKQDTKLGGEKVSCSQPFADLGRASYKQTFLFPKLLSRASARSSEIVNGTKALPTKRPKLQLRRGGSRVFQIRLEWWSFRSVSELVECGRIQRQFF